MVHKTKSHIILILGMYTDKSLKCYVHNVLFRLNMVFTIFGNYNLFKSYCNSKSRISFRGYLHLKF